jgi:6-phosphogluconolactonase
MTTPNVQVYPTPEALTQAAVEQIITLLQGLEYAHIALSGGSTPKPVYEGLAAQKERMDWSTKSIFWSDERCVPPDHPDSNYRMAHKALLQHIKPYEVLRMKGELDPQAAAEEYNQQIQLQSPNSPLSFDLVLLGMGDDGHTASLFPHTSALNTDEVNCVANYVPKLDSWRLTLTSPIINHAHHVMFLITGESKANALYEVLHGEYNPQEYPSQLIKPTEGQLLFLVDEKAASKLP